MARRLSRYIIGSAYASKVGAHDNDSSDLFDRHSRPKTVIQATQACHSHASNHGQPEATAAVIGLFLNMLEAILPHACFACAGQANQARSTSVFNLP